MNGPELKRLIETSGLVNRIWRDTRWPVSHNAPDLRTFTLAAVWVCDVDMPGTADGRWERVETILGLDSYRFWGLIGDDAPRYEPPRGRYAVNGCSAPLVRRDGPCGKSPATSFRVTDAATGQWQIVGFCRRHLDYAAKVKQAERDLLAAGNIPEPAPNTGGLLPCYIDCDWPKMYTRARSWWTPPGAGICADDWPALAKTAPLDAPPTLRLVSGGQAGTGGTGRPVLTVVTDQ